MRLREKRYDQWSSPYWQGRYKHHKVEISEQLNGKFYFLLKKDGKSFNSLWENMQYESIDEAAKAAKNYIDIKGRGKG